MTNLRKTYKKVWLVKNLHVIIKKSYKNLMKNLRQHYRYLTKT